MNQARRIVAMDNIEVIGIDHGWSQMKTVNAAVFSSGIREILTEPAFYDDVLEYDGKYYKVGTARETVMENKVENDDYANAPNNPDLANTFRTFADKQEVDYSQKEKKFSKTDAIKKPWEAYRKSCEKFKLRLDAMIDKCENLSLDVELHKQEKNRSVEVVQSIMPMVAEKEYQYGADAFEAFQSTDKAKGMAKAISTPDRDSEKIGKGR